MGAIIVDQLKSDPTEEEIVHSLLEQYEVDESTALNDIAQVLQKSRLHGVLFEG